MKISRRDLARAAALSSAGMTGAIAAQAVENVAPGVWRFRFGNPEKITPSSTRKHQPDTAGLRSLPARPPVP